MPPGLFTRGLARQELEREFESHSLRQTVWVAEKLGGLALKIARNGRNSATPSSQTGPEKVTRSMLISGLWPFSPKGTKAVRFERLHQANAKRS